VSDVGTPADGEWTAAAVRAGLSAWGVLLPDEAEHAEVAVRLTLLVRLISGLAATLDGEDLLTSEVPALPTPRQEDR
jgi:hypothetical protein